ncbi:MAG: hypothetical protein M3R48_01495 [Candidatus Dormibacteraeota bacterium]|nr:hypothetical protein [Candidatus Dormibacteraeota bacterium]
MSSGWRPVDGDEITVTPGGTPSAAGAGEDIHAAEASGSAGGDDLLGPDNDDHDQDQVAHRRGRTTDNRLLILGAILVVVVAQLVVSFLVLSSINDVRDQSASSNGLQHCLINAQLKQASSSNAAAYQSAVQACVSK